VWVGRPPISWWGVGGGGGGGGGGGPEGVSECALVT
jgi:hypothetical protein